MKILKNLRDKNPLIHCITNYVTVNDVANSLLSIGASPVMADDELEVAQMCSLANSLLINIGTLNSGTINSMKQAVKMANRLEKPIVLDPVGVGATSFRNETALELLDMANFTLIRANASEISFLAGLKGTTNGVDVCKDDLNKSLDSKIQTAKFLAKKQECIVAMSGQTDIITDGKNVAICKNGHEMMSKITGSGCMLGAILSAFLSAEDDKFMAGVLGVATFGICGENAYEKMQNLDAGNASFRTFLIDELGKINDEILTKRQNIEIL